MHPVPRFVTSWHWFASGCSQQGSHVVRQCAHRLQTFAVQRRLTRFTSVYYVPVLRGYNRHAHHLEWHVQSFERRGCSTSAAYGNSSCGLAPEGSSVRIERPLDNGKHRTVRLAPIHRGSYDKCIGRVRRCIHGRVCCRSKRFHSLCRVFPAALQSQPKQWTYFPSGAGCR